MHGDIKEVGIGCNAWNGYLLELRDRRIFKFNSKCMFDTHCMKIKNQGKNET